MLLSRWTFARQLIDYARARSSRLRDESGAVNTIELVIIVAAVVIAALAIINSLMAKATSEEATINF